MTVTKLAVIPARGGSTRLPHKNRLPLAGKPLIRWSVEAVVNSGEFDTVIVSTDDDAIWDCVKDLPVQRHVRPPAHATTRATVLNAMIDLMKHVEKHDIFAYFLPTCPFIQPKWIQEGVKELVVHPELDSVVSVSSYEEPIQLACIQLENKRIVPVFDNLTSGLTNSKFIQKYVKPNGGFYMSRWNTLLETNNFFKGNVKGITIPHQYLVDIDYQEDLEKAEYLWKNVLSKL